MGWFDERFVESKTRIRRECESCRKPMWLPKSKVELYRRCDVNCGLPAKTLARKARTKACKTCGVEFVPRPAQVKAGHGVYCSQKCNTTARDVLQDEVVQKRAADGFRKAVSDGRVKFRRGPENSMWNGGKEAAAERRRESVRKYKKENPDRVRVWAHNRREKTTGRFSSLVVRELMALQKNRCAICAKKLADDFHLDHIVPVALGGKNEKSNAQILCPPCNLHKAAKDPIAFMQSLGRLC